MLAGVWATETEGFGGLLSTLSVGDRLIAVHLGMRSSQVWHSWFPAYDPALASYSPGLLLLLRMAESARGLGLNAIDLGPGTAPYKQVMMSHGVPLAEGSVDTTHPHCACHSHPPHDEIARPAHRACAQGQAGAAQNDRPPVPTIVNRTRILNFHGVGPPPRGLEPGEERVWLTVDEVKRVLDLIAGQPNVAITVDDGNRSDVELLLPELRRRGLSATFFVVAGRIGNDHFLGWDDLSALTEAGMRIGSHGMHHRSWCGLPAVALHEEVVQAKLVLEAGLGRPIDEAALPFGDYGRRVLLAARHAGYRHVYTSDGGSADPRRWLQPRISLTAGLTDEGLRAVIRPLPARQRALILSKRLAKSLR